MEGLPDWVGTLPGWLTAGGTLGTLAAAWKVVPEWLRARREDKRQDYDIAAALRGEFSELLQNHKHDIDKLRQGLLERDARISATENFCGAIIIRTQQMDFVLTLVLEELEQQAPGNPIAKQARHLMSGFVKIEPPTQEIKDQLATIKQPSLHDGEQP